jgi:type I restriction enzyme M protein
MSAVHYDHVNFIWTIANLLRGPYKPAQYRKVMLPLAVLRLLDCVLAPTKDKVIAEYTKLKFGKLKEEGVERTLKQKAGHQFYNTSALTFEKMVAAQESIAADLKSYINGFSSNARSTFCGCSPR